MSRPRFPWAWLWVISVLLTPILAADVSLATPKGDGHVHTLLVHPEGEILLVGTHRGLFRSPDAGVTWNRVSPQGELPGSDFMTLAMHPQTHSRIYAGGHDLGILRSEDFGQTWQRAAQGIPSTDVHALAVDPPTVALMTPTGTLSCLRSSCAKT